MKIKFILKFIVSIFFLLCFQNFAYAILELELTKGIDRALPVALVPFQFQGNAKPSTDINNIIATDLKNSGQFKLFNKELIKQFPGDLLKVDFDYWKTTNVDGILIGNIKEQGFGKYRVNFTLVDIYGKSRNRLPSATKESVGADSVLASEEFEVSDQDLRRLAHHIADVVYEKLLGERGVFSTKIAYVVANRRAGKLPIYSLVIADADGYNPRYVLRSNQPIMSPSWSPDGKQIAYVSFENHRASIFTSDLASGSRRLVSQFPSINGAPSWSPDGRQLALVLSKDGSPNVYIMDISSGNLRQITNNMAINTEPNWAPDGQSIIFTSDVGGAPQIYQTYLSDGQMKRVTYSGSYNAKASFTSDGKSIVMLHRDKDIFTIALQNLETGVVTVLTSVGDSQSPSIAPNGKMVIFASHYGNRDVLGLVSTDGRIKLRLPETDGDVSEPVWSPFVS